MIIGLTGGIATGKSTVTKILRQKGFTVIDADQIVHDLQQKGSPVLAEIRDLFGAHILDKDGHLNRKELGKIIFNNPESKHKLEAIIHPSVNAEILKQIEASEPPVFLDIPLLFETGMEAMCDITIVVYISVELQLKRLMARDNLTEADALNRINNQMPLDGKKQLADYIIDNSGDLNQLENNINAFLKGVNLQ